jgi:hypothetical protein
MGLAARPGTGMAGMLCAFVFDNELAGRKRRLEFPPDCVSDRHESSVSSVLQRKSSDTFSCFSALRYHNRRMTSAKQKPRFKRDMRIKPEAPHVEPETKLRPCGRPGCPDEGGYKVTRSRDRLGEYIWLCLAHAREHNESWDYFRGMDEKDIESFRSDAITGHRPTWPLGKRTARMHNGHSMHVDDGFGQFERDAEPQSPRRPERTLTRLQMQALDVLHLPHGATLIEIKARYKELVKRFHPDANGGDRGAEERLKQVIKAYGVLRASGLT